MQRRTALVATAAMFAIVCTARAETLPLPAGVVGFTSTEGEALFIGAEARGDYFPLSIHFTNQVNPAFCGPATISMILNALGVPRPPSDMTLGLGLFDQENVFTPATDAVETKAGVLADGMTLDQFGGVLKAHDLSVDIRHAGDTNVDDFRKAAVAALEDDDHFVAVNYLRKAIGQETGGHISPLAAYDADTDRFLILDVSRYKYPPIWVEAAALYGAMNTPDASNGDKTRGYVIVGR